MGLTFASCLCYNTVKDERLASVLVFFILLVYNIGIATLIHGLSKSLGRDSSRLKTLLYGEFYSFKNLYNTVKVSGR